MIYLQEDVEVSTYPDNNSKFLVSCQSVETKLLIDNDTFRLIELLKKTGECEFDFLYNEYTRLTQENIDFEIFKTAINQLSKLGIIYNSEVKYRKRKHKYLKIKAKLLPKSFVVWLSKLFSHLFNKQVILFTLITIPFVITYMIVNFKKIEDSSEFEESFFIFGFIFLYLSVLFHEIGHASALVKRGLIPGEIGFGLYLFIMPVFYTNLDEIWKLPSKKRFLVNMGGVYFQYLFGLIFFFIGFFDPAYFLLTTLIFASALMQFNPIIRLDGYWILSDYFKEPNVVKKAKEKFRTLVVDILKNKPIKYTKKEYLFILFGVLSSSYILVLYLLLILNFWEDLIVSFPEHLNNLKGTFSWKALLSFDFIGKLIQTILPIGLFLGIGFYIYQLVIFIIKVNYETKQP